MRAGEATQERPEPLARPGAASAVTPEPGRRRPHGSRTRRGLRWLSTVAIVVGALMLTDAGITLVWQEPLTHLFTARQQAVLGARFDRLRAAPVPPAERPALGQLREMRQRIAFLARALGRTAGPGSAIGEIRLPRIDKRYVVVKGSDAADLRKGPGSYDDVGLPGVPGTAAIAGHRTTYGAPFRDIDKLRKGDAIVVEMPYATFTYRVERTRIVEPTDLSVLKRRRYDRLVLSACHPLYSAAKRIVVLARLTKTTPSAKLT